MSPHIVRTTWSHGFPPAYINAKWSAAAGVACLQRRPGYFDAKKLGDLNAAVKVIEPLLRRDTIFSVGDCISRQDTYLFAPARTYVEPANALPHIYALMLANELKIKICTSIYQQDGPKRDRSGFWDRFANPVVYGGNIFRNSDYIVVDDVFSTGGTIAALKGFIENQGGRVICVTTIAGANGANTPIAVGTQTLKLLNSKHGTALSSFMKMEIGYGQECLTEPEARALLQARTVNSIRTQVAKARHE